jgi:hypothetical protein
MARGYPAGSPCDLLREHLDINAAASFGAGPKDDWLYEAIVDSTPARLANVHDTTAYPAPPAMVVTNWLSRLRGWGTSPANNSAPANNTQGGLT